MKVWKFLVLLGGLAGIGGFFRPFASAHVEQPSVTVELTAYQLVKGIKFKELVKQVENVEHSGRSRVDADRLAKELEEGTPSIAGGAAVLVYVPAALLALLGAIAVARGKLGRFGGLVSLLLGAISSAVWALLYIASHEAKQATVLLGIGAHLLLVAGLAGVLAGLGAIISPDRGS